MVVALEHIRRLRGLSQRELAEKAGVSPATVYELEVGKRPTPRPSTLRKLAEALEVEIADLLGEPAVPLAKAPRGAGLPAKEESIFDLAHDAVLRQHRTDTQAANRTASAEGIPQPARFQEHDNALVTVLLGRDPSEVVGEFVELMHDYVRLEQKIAQLEENAQLREEHKRVEAEKA